MNSRIPSTNHILYWGYLFLEESAVIFRLLKQSQFYFDVVFLLKF